MLTRVCAGGVVFMGDKVLLLKNDKDEWVLPKGVIRNSDIAQDVAVKRVMYEGGIEARIISPAGETSYEFYSYSRKLPVCNKVDWFIMESDCGVVNVNKEEGFKDGGFYPVEEAVEKITYSQDRSLVRLAFRKYNYYRQAERATTVS